MLHYPQLGGGRSDWPIERHVWVLLNGRTGYWYRVPETGKGTLYQYLVMVLGSALGTAWIRQTGAGILGTATEPSILQILIQSTIAEYWILG